MLRDLMIMYNVHCTYEVSCNFRISDNMPHFYQNRVEDNFEPQPQGQTPAAQSPAPVREVAEGAVAHVSLLACGADLTVPEAGAETNKRNLNYICTQLENTIKELKDDNKQLRKDVSICNNTLYLVHQLFFCASKQN